MCNNIEAQIAEMEAAEDGISLSDEYFQFGEGELDGRVSRTSLEILE